MNDYKIGLFDSGLGGLTILKAVTKALPQYDYVFFGDTAHLPLGDKTEEEIFEYTRAGVEELFERDCALVIIACNTASAETMRRLQDTFLPQKYPDRRILGVIIPTVEELIESKSKKALLLATKRTVESGKYGRELLKYGSDIELHSVATPELVPLIESGKSAEAANLAIKIIEDQLNGIGEIDTVILGCTHYAKFKDDLRRAFPSAMPAQAGQTTSATLKILSQDEIIPHKLALYLLNHPEIESRLSRDSTRSIHLSVHRPDYDQIAADLLGGIIV
ncbi:glutamate racemase [Candidatus Kaiserbacteria bacterium RIFOXYB1_FULL_46_14]|uniref:Glutamate racemase n=1 Tax=Candidatus Kaiserbacteria bacterium RIFOXYB1_FULL_46_14 TaxID=1798531 RepID=A0A1F6FJI2_9BACT|nr:MAG: glutamate racemase [Candidatus Kaiserbacteria bacterium RIFOXYB1_FULL_46_14]